MDCGKTMSVRDRENKGSTRPRLPRSKKRHQVVAEVSSTTGFGVFNTNTGGNLTLDHSDIKASTNSIRNDNGSAKFYVGSSKPTGIAWGSVKCVFSFDDSYAPLTSTCTP
jgi:hypothetical protein